MTPKDHSLPIASLEKELLRLKRELEIEASLERVRARTLTMHKSEELAETAYLLFNEFRKLGEAPDQITIGIIDESKGQVEFWLTLDGKHMNRAVTSPLGQSSVIDQLYKSWKSHHKSLTIDLSGKELVEYLESRKRFSQASQVKSVDIPGEDRRVITAAYFSKGFLTFSTPSPPGQSSLPLLERFAGAFDLTYTRFLDLQKAEAQTREAKIEAALEKVRSRSLAMHKTDELKDVIAVVFEKLQELGVPMDGGAHISIYNDEVKGMTNWLAAPDFISEPMKFYLPYYESPVLSDFWEARPTGVEYLSKVYPYEVKSKFYNYIFIHTDYKDVPQNVKELITLSQSYAYSGAFSKYSGIVIHSHFGKILSEPDGEILKRFAKVFEQAFTRFLDLQKAEEQAREAQIEAALERVRSRSMAMHKSEELREVIQIVFEQLRQLNFHIDSAQFDMNFRDSDDLNLWTAVPGQPYSTKQHVPYFDNAVFNSIKDAKEAGLNLATANFTFEEKNQFFNHFFKYASVPEERKKYVLSSPGFVRSAVFLDRLYLGIQNYSGIPYSEVEHAILLRFAKVFEQTYTRFLDLQKAEAQTREAQIEASLERVRAKTMAMHSSQDVTAATETMFDELKKLGSDNLRCGMANIHTNRTMDVFGITNLEGGSKMTGFGLFGMDEHPIWQRLFDSWLNKEDFVCFLAGKEKEEYFKNIDSHRGYLPQQLVDFPDNYFHCYYFDQGIVWAYSLQPHSDSDSEIMKRFATVFSLTYRRYQDLRKAEAQAREAQIEASLERVRSRTMAMHNSEDVVEATSVVFMELHRLGIETLRCGILLIDESKTMEVWSTTRAKEGQPAKIIGRLDMTIHPSLVGLWHAWKNREEWYEYLLKGQDRINYYQTLSSIPGYQSWSQFMNDPDHSLHACIFDAGALYIFAVNPLSSEDRGVMKRFTVAFSQTFLRYRDLQKAEAQTHEAQIEAALERVRAASMAMHKSQELHEVIKVISEQLINLGLKFDSTNFIRVLEDGRWDTWISTPVQTYPALVNMPYIDLVSVNEINTTIRQGRELITSYSKEVKDAFFHHFFMNSAARDIPDQRKEYVMNSPGWAISIFIAKNIGLAVSNYRGIHFSETDNDLIRRFAKVFEQSYTRFLDLQKAEAQAREAQIETSVERVRSQAMAMRTSEELLKAAEVLRNEMIALKVEGFTGASFYMVDENDWVSMWDFSDVGNLGKPTAWRAHWDAKQYAILGEFWRIWKDGVPYFVIEFGPDKIKKALEEWYEVDKNIYSIIREAIEKGQLTTQWNVMGSMARGVLSLDVLKPPTEDTKQIVLKMASAFDLAYQRFEDLKLAEAQTLEAIKRASVDRIRAEIASMRTTGDLQKITPLIWSELTTLGVPFIRCGVFIMDEELRQVHTFLSTPNGKAIATLHLPFDFDLSLTINAIDHWRHKKLYTEHWDATKFVESWTKLSTLAEASVSSTQAEAPPENLYLHMLPFLQGMLYVGNVEPLTDDMIHLLESVTEAFSTAYARYEDFNRLEAANSKIEKTLVDLKQTQAQLVQSEKMASLGELTAGIAHEIQNPLNFVNNFSEVNKELLTEMNDAIQKGNFNEAKTLAKDIIDNSEKINQHGKRADTIVKGMLQHSRTSSAVKEPTDINALADEYLRLAYHGLRAKDKTFNATTKTEFDSHIGPIQIIPQDIGRVILNLITNGFYAVTERSKQQSAGYKPTVVVCTKKMDGKVLITVKDNGIGIPPHIVDKIFQPFFTTKPTGQGTGLGLSMSYDIVKAHGGELRVETKEGDGSTFTIQLPN